MNRNFLLSQAQTSSEFKTVNKLYDYLGDRDITFESIIEFIIVEYGFMRRHHAEIKNIKRILKYIGMDFPSEYGTFLSRVSEISLSEFLQNLRNECRTHSQYAYIATYILLRKKYKNISEFKYSDIKAIQQEIIYPKWIRLIWDRQYRLMKNASLSDDNFFFFMYTKDGQVLRSINEQDVSNVYAAFRSRYGYTVAEYIHDYYEFSGMSSGAVHIVNFKRTLENIISKRIERNYNRIVRVTDMQQNTWQYGVCLGETETGIYTVICQDDKIYTVPFYRFDMPSSGERFDWVLSKGYYIVDGVFAGKWTDLIIKLNKEKYVHTYTHNRKPKTF